MELCASSRSRRLTFLLVVAAFVGGQSDAQCFEWKGGFGLDGVDGRVFASIVHDDGSGPALYVGGEFRNAGGTPADRIARWNGVSWGAVGGGLPGPVTCFEVYDDGSGAALYAGVEIQSGLAAGRGLWKLTGTIWTQIPGSESCWITSLRVFDSGNGPELYVGGLFDDIGGVTSPALARWNGSAWSDVGGGLWWTSRDAVRTIAMVVFDDGAGPALYCSYFSDWPPGFPWGGLKRWDGSSWSDLLGIVNRVAAVHDDGSGEQLYVAVGASVNIGGVAVRHVARWNGSAWSDAGAGFPGIGTESMSVFDRSDGPKLYAATATSPAPSNAYQLAAWDGTSWSLVPGAIAPGTSSIGVSTLTPFHDAHGPALFVGGTFGAVGARAVNNVVSFDGASYRPLGEVGIGLSSSVNALATFDDGNGTELYATGSFVGAGGVHAIGIARFDGAQWSALGASTKPYGAMHVFDDGGGSALYVAAPLSITSTQLRRFDGSTFTTVGIADRAIDALEVFDDGNGDALYAGGEFVHVDGTFAPGVAKWTGSSWSALGFGINGRVRALSVFDDGSGPALYAAGAIVVADKQFVSNIARWDGTSWSDVGGGTNGGVLDLQVFDDGNGAQLYAAGGFTHAGATATPGIARWNGTDWQPVGGGVDGCSGASCTPTVQGLGVYDDGSGDALYVGGNFDTAGGVDARGVARWDGSAWSALDLGVDGAPLRIAGFATFDDGLGDALYVAGTFARAGEWPSSNIAKWAPCGVSPGNGFCFGDGSLVTPCPCVAPNVVPSPSGAADAGCANSFHLGGARLTSSGSITNDNVSLRASDLPPSALAIFFTGSSSNAVGIAVGDGVRCADGALVRFGTQNASAGVARYPFAALGHILPLSSVSGFIAGSGARAHYQALYRNPAAGFCSAGTVNLTNAQQIDW